MNVVDQTARALPEFGVLAGKLAAIADLLPGADNQHREALRNVAAAMNGEPSLAQASMHTVGALTVLAAKGMPDQAETWLLLACMTLLAHEKMRLAGGVAIAPAGTRAS